MSGAVLSAADGRARLSRAHDLFARGDGDEALALAQQVIDAADASAALAAEAHATLAAFVMYGERADEALRHINAARERLAGMKDLRVESLVESVHSNVLRELGQGEGAATAAGRALQLAQDARDSGAMIQAQLAAGASNWMLGQLDKALAFYLEAERLARPFGSAHLVQRCHNDLGITYSVMAQASAQRGDEAVRAAEHARGIAHLRSALDINRAQGQVAQMVMTLCNLSQALHDSGDAEGSWAAIQEAVEVAQRHRLGYGHVAALMGVGELQLARSQPEAARATLSSALALAEQAAQNGRLPEILRLLTEACVAVGDLPAALAALKRHHGLLLEQKSLQAQRRARAIAVQGEARLEMARERQRIVRDVHDGIGSNLVTFLSMLERGDLDEASMLAGLHDCIADLELTLGPSGFLGNDVTALLTSLRERHTHRLRAAGIEVGWALQPTPALRWLEPKHALSITRILQEALTNVARHAQARCATIGVAPAATGGTTEARAGIEVSIADDGIGFDVENARELRGRGLLHMRERALGLGGSLRLSSERGTTVVTLWLPLETARY